MADNDKTLKITSVFDSKGDDRLKRTTEELRKVYDSFGRVIKELSRDLQGLEQIQKRRVENITKENEALKTQIDRLQAIRQHQQSAAQSGYGVNDWTAANRGYGPRIAGAGGGRIPPGVNTSPYEASPGGFSGSTMLGLAKVLGFAGAGVRAIGGGISSYGDYMQHSGRNIEEEKFRGMEGLAGAVGYRNKVFSESRSSPGAWMAYRAAHQFNLKNAETPGVSIDDQGRIIQPEGGLRGVSGGQFTGRSGNMAGLEEEHEGKIVSGVGRGVSAGGMALMGAGALAGGIYGAQLGAAVGSVAPGLGNAVGAIGGGVIGAAGGAIASGGVGMIVSAIREGTAAYFEVQRENKKWQEGLPEALQAADKEKSEDMQDRVMAIQKYQMGVFQGMAPMLASINRQTMGFGGEIMGGNFDFDLGERSAAATGAFHKFGRAGKSGYNAIMSAMRGGMSMGGATDIVGTFETLGGKGNGEQHLQRMWQLAVKQGMESVDMPFFEKLAGAATKVAYSSATGMLGPGAGGLLFAGMDKPNAFRVQEREKGLQALDNLQKTNYFSGRRMVEAFNIMGKGADISHVMALAGASVAELFSGSARLTAHGVTETQRKGAVKGLEGDITGVLRGHKETFGTMGNKSGHDYLADLFQRLHSKNPQVKSNAAREKEKLASFAETDVEGLDFRTAQEVIEALGGGELAVNQLASGERRRLKGQGGAGAIEAGATNRTLAEDTREGIKLSQDVDTALSIVGDPEKMSTLKKYLGSHPGIISDKDLDRFAYTSDRSGSMAQKINTAWRGAAGKAAQDAGEGYGSSEKLAKSLGQLDKLLGDEKSGVNGALKRFQNQLENIIRTMGGRIPTPQRGGSANDVKPGQRR